VYAFLRITAEIIKIKEQYHDSAVAPLAAPAMRSRPDGA
jgi:hypothetical protein